MSQMFESLEPRRLFSSTIPVPTGTYTGKIIPIGRGARNAFDVLTGTDSHHHKPIAGALDLTVAGNGTTVGSLTLGTSLTYNLAGDVIIQSINLSAISGGKQIGDVSGFLDARFKKASGRFTEVIDGKTYRARFVLRRKADSSST